MNERRAERRAYVWAAKGLVSSPKYGAAARRYLSLARRERELQRAARAQHNHARSAANADHPLTQIRFAPPLSVAGCSSPVVVRAEGLAHRRIPVAFERDEKGRHRGTTGRS